MRRALAGRSGLSSCFVRVSKGAATAFTVVSLMAGCAANPSLSHRNSVEKWLNEKPRTMTLALADSPMPVLINRESTFLRKVATGAAKGALAGLMVAAYALGHSSSSDGEVALVLVAVTVPTFAVAGMVHGAATAEPKDTLTEIDGASRFQRFADATKDGGFDRRLAARVTALGNARKDLTLRPGRSGDSGMDAPSVGAHGESGTEGVVTLSVETVGLLRDRSVDDGLSLYIEGRTLLDLPSRGEVEWAVWRYRGDPRPREEWLADEALIDREIGRATHKLADRIIGGIAGPGSRRSWSGIPQDARAVFLPN